MNKSLLTLSLIPIASVMHTYGTSHVPDNRPNIILFLVDDMGWQDTSLPFWTQRTMYNERYETPNMGKLAQQGMMFTQAYASSISSPTRKVKAKTVHPIMNYPMPQAFQNHLLYDWMIAI